MPSDAKGLSQPIDGIAKLAKHAPQSRARSRRRPTEELREAVIFYLAERDGVNCRLCHKPVAWEEISIDHIVPTSRGGAHRVENFQLAHKFCHICRENREKARKHRNRERRVTSR